MIWGLWLSSLSKFVRTLSAECLTNLNPLVTASSKRSTEEFLFAESRQMNVLYVNASYEWVTNRGIIPGECCPIFLAQTDHQKWGIFSIVTGLQTTQHKTNQNLPKNSCKLADFRQNLQCNCGLQYDKESQVSCKVKLASAVISLFAEFGSSLLVSFVFFSLRLSIILENA